MSHIPGNFGKRMGKCPCCDNPWNQDNAGMDSFVCAPCIKDSKGVPGLDPDNFDSSVNPADNFYLWSNGGWRAKNPIPEEYPSWNTFIVLRDLNLERLKAIVDDLQSSKDGAVQSVQEKKLADFFNSFMDMAAIEEAGIAPIMPILSMCKGVKTNPEKVMAELHAEYGVGVLFALYSSPDKSNSVHSIGSLYQSGLGLPDKDYYIDADKAEKRERYVEYAAKLFALLGAGGVAEYTTESQCNAAATALLEFEIQLASCHLTRTAARDPQLTYNKMSINDLNRRSKSHPITWSQYLSTGLPPPFDWKKYFAAVGKDEVAMGEINVATVDAITSVASMLESPFLPHYLAFHVANSFATNLGSAFVDLHFEFFDQYLKGTAVQQPRWKTALGKLESALGDELGKLYVAKHFSGDAKPTALRIVESVRDALRVRLGEVDWMSESTRKAALIKMEKFKVKIGFPDKWLDYSTMNVVVGNHIGNVLEARQYGHRLELSRMNAPTDTDRWFMTPQTVNAYYHPSLNEIVFPAAILQPPFFDPAADLAVQYGSLGAVVGHEMTHGFDDQGRKYDDEGNLRDWWTAEDGVEYQKRVDVMVAQAGEFEVHGLKLNGKLTCGENVADLGGVKLSLRALQAELRKRSSSGLPPPPLINGFTPTQRLFLAWSQNWRENVKKERAIQLVTLDPHGPNEMRCNGTLRNVDEFHEAFAVPEESAMFLAKNKRVDIW